MVHLIGDVSIRFSHVLSRNSLGMSAAELALQNTGADEPVSGEILNGKRALTGDTDTAPGGGISSGPPGILASTSRASTSCAWPRRETIKSLSTR